MGIKLHTRLVKQFDQVFLTTTVAWLQPFSYTVYS